MGSRRTGPETAGTGAGILARIGILTQEEADAINALFDAGEDELARELITARLDANHGLDRLRRGEEGLHADSSVA